MIVVDDSRPTAVVEAPQRIGAGQSFALSGKRSVDLAPGRIVQYRWTQVS